DRLFELGIDDLSLGDTIGSAVPAQVEALLDAVTYRYPNKSIIMHFHDTRGMAVANIMTAMNYGMTRFDSLLVGLGGCRYAPGAEGNVTTNDLLYLVQGLDVETGINEQKVQDASFFIQDKLNKDLPSRSYSYINSQFEQYEEQAQVAGAETSKHQFELVPQRKREIVYVFLKNQLKNQY